MGGGRSGGGGGGYECEGGSASEAVRCNGARVWTPLLVGVRLAFPRKPLRSLHSWL